MKSSMEPPIQFFPSTISEHLSKSREHHIEATHERMDLADLPESHLIFVCEINTHGIRNEFSPSEFLQNEGSEPI